MLTTERKAQMVESLKKDYVVLTDIVCEVVADIEADMIVLSREKGETEELKKDEMLLHKLDRIYDIYVREAPEKAVDVIEQIYELSEKYDKLRTSAEL
ncbi:hypothetical protein [Aggregatibacter actinomycetemcomitans]|uniref:hypothetical protein n=1 Tax=Aggregatibacter actinomycetemcomitans TaxID=714 RepID=UPI00023FFF40|nr:hypothetical protein [Aggregatibacter actinomycetemcomitans]EHK90183.1 hypothetical protein RHAA1_05388 [Aggregatibacter actinomycetemcomitans RhAA1]KNE77258.1 hypothetical protein RHAA2_05475 [Aggregatibacter actinomycetemcomitans RhAA1]